LFGDGTPRRDAQPLRPRACEAVSLQSVGQFGRVAHRDHVATVDHVNLDFEPIAGDPTLKLEREHPIVAGSQHSGRDIVLGWQPDRDRVLSAGGEFGDEPMPFPGVAAPPGIRA